MVTPIIVSLFFENNVTGITSGEPTGMEVNGASPPFLRGWGEEKPQTLKLASWWYGVGLQIIEHGLPHV